MISDAGNLLVDLAQKAKDVLEFGKMLANKIGEYVKTQFNGLLDNFFDFLESPEVEFQLHRCEAYQASCRGRNQQSFELELSWKFVKGRTSPPLKNTTFSGLCPFTVPVVLVAHRIIGLV